TYSKPGASPMAGYSGTPLPKKLGLKPGFRIALAGAYREAQPTLDALELPEGARFETTLDGTFDCVLLFVESTKALRDGFAGAAETLVPEGMLWIAWPKKASGRKTDIDENIVRDIGLAEGLVDVKVCAIDDVWSGLKFVIRLKDRPKTEKPR